MRNLTVAFALVMLISATACGQEKRTAQVRIQAPATGFRETQVTVNGTEVKGAGGLWNFTTAPLQPGQEMKLKVEALIQPNNYTRITRPRELTVKAGDTVTLDLTTEDKKLDKIVVRWVPTPNDIVDKMAEMAKIGKDDIVFDPGCGDAVMLIRPVKKLGAKKGIGIEIDPKMVKVAQEKATAEGVAERVVIQEGDILNEKDMAVCAEATVVLIYIGDDLGARMAPVLKKLLKPGTRIVSHRFLLGDWKPDKTVPVRGEDGDEYVLHYWEVKAK